MSDEELAMLRALAERDGLSASDVLRLFIRRAYAEAFGDKKPPRIKK
jgi:DNA-binding GntR family transcriptional regulator